MPTYKVVTTVTVSDKDLLLGDWLIDTINDKLDESNFDGEINTFQITRIADHYIETHIENAKNDIQMQVLEAA